LEEQVKCNIAEGLRVLDLGVGMASALVVKLLREAGAEIVRIAPPGGDPFVKVYPAYELWKKATREAPTSDRAKLCQWAEVCIIGGEDFPNLQVERNAEAIAASNDKLVVVDIGCFGGARAVDLLVQARLGLVNEQLSTQPIRIAASTPTYGAALTALLGLWAALIEREATGRGQIVYATMEQGAALFWSQIWMDATHPDAMFDMLPPKDVRHLIFKCEDGGYVHFVLGVPGALAKLYKALSIPIAVDKNDRGLPSLERGPQGYFADPTWIEPAVAKWKRDDLVQALWDAGIAAEPVLAPGEAWDDPQIAASGILHTDTDGRRFIGTPISVRDAGPPAPEPRRHCIGGPSGPLSGLRVIDLGNFIAGPFASKLLADLGADVIKVEPPGGLGNLTGLRNTWSCNRGKRSIIIDLKQPEGLEVVHKLCASADVAHHNFRLGVAARIGVDPASLRERAADLITLETSGYGSVGPKADKPGWDMVMQALSGMEVRAGGKGNPPLWYRSALVDYGTGTMGAIAILMAVYRRQRVGAPVEVQVSLMATAFFMLAELVQEADGSLVGAPQLNSRRTGYHPAEQLYATRDGWIAVAARSDAMAADFARTLGLEDALGARADWKEQDGEKIAARLEVLSTADALSRLERAGVWAENCTTEAWPALRENNYARQSNLVITASDATYGEITGCFGPSVILSGRNDKGRTFVSAPRPGEHTKELLADLGFCEAQIEQLFSNKVVM
jgi:crotonobetainyl-CoA:carnitine CoA-transferase CaiB-like acyl-CoA transferase